MAQLHTIRVGDAVNSSWQRPWTYVDTLYVGFGVATVFALGLIVWNPPLGRSR
jgi:hypothetical protein